MEISGLPPGKIFIEGELESRLTGLKVGDFKSFRGEHYMHVAPITLVFGKNSSGKSAIIQSLVLLKEMTATDDADVRCIKTGSKQIDLGGFQNFVNRTSDSKADEVRIDVKFSSRMYREQTTDYGVTLGVNPMVDNQWARNGIYGRDLDYISKRVRIANGGLKLEAEVNVNLKGVESYRKPYSYFVLLGSTDIFSLPVKPDTALLKKMIEIVGKQFSSVNQEKIKRDQEIKRVTTKAAMVWLKKQRRLFSYTCSGANLQLSGFLAGGFMICDDDIADWVDYFVQTGDSDTREDAVRSLREYISIECAGELERLGISEEALFKKVLEFIDLGIPAEFDLVCSDSYLRFSQLMDSIRYLGPIREIPGRILTNKFSNVSRKSEGSADSVYAAIREDSHLRHRVNRWLSGGLFSKKYSFDLDDRNQLQLFELGSHANIEISLQDVGSGLSQVIPVITFCLGNSLKTLLLEQPELHLHPSGAAEMGDLLIQSALVERGNTIIAETHSEHIILRILKRIRQTAKGVLPDNIPPVKPEDVSIIFVQPRGDGNGSEVISIPVTEDGDIFFGWPDGFMPDRLSELIDDL